MGLRFAVVLFACQLGLALALLGRPGLERAGLGGAGLGGRCRRAATGTQLRAGVDVQNLLESFEATSPWMSASGAEALPALVQKLDLAQYIDSPWLASQPVVVRIGLGLLVIDVIPLALDVLVFKSLLGKAFGLGGSGDGTATAPIDLDVNILSAADACKYFDANSAVVSARSSELLSCFYRDVGATLGQSSTTPPEVLLFEAVTRLSPAFQAVANLLLEERLVRSGEVEAYLRRSIVVPRGSAEVLVALSRAVAAGGGGLRRLVGDPSKAQLLHAASPLGLLFLAGAGAGAGSSSAETVVVGLRLRPSGCGGGGGGGGGVKGTDGGKEGGKDGGAAAAAVLSSDQELQQAALDLYIIRRLLQTVAAFPATAAKAQTVLGLVDSSLDAVLQLRRVFDPRAGPVYSADDVAVVSFASIYDSPAPAAAPAASAA